MAHKSTGKPVGRPPIEIDKDQFEKLCAIFCTEEDIANIFDCNIDTVSAWCERTYGQNFSEMYKKLSSRGRASLRRYQFAQAKKSPAMAIFLGKNYLGQTDKDDIDKQIAEQELQVKKQLAQELNGDGGEIKIQIVRAGNKLEEDDDE